MMYKRVQTGIISVPLCVFILVLGLVTPVPVHPEEEVKKPVEVQTGQKPEVLKATGQVVPNIADGNKGDAGVDLVVSKVEITRGSFDGGRKIQITPYVRNMWSGSTSSRIKILLDGLALAEWIEGGIGPGEEKKGGPLYVRDATGSTVLNFSVEVDDGNKIPENNEHNNRCENLTFGASQTREVLECPIAGPHEPSR